MYAWCQMFIFIAYLMLYGVLKTKKDIYYLLMAICSLGAVYSHYFALASIGFMYIILLFYMIKTSICDIKGFCIRRFWPWLVYTIIERGEVMANYNLGFQMQLLNHL